MNSIITLAVVAVLLGAGAVSGGPISVSDNNVGDIVTVGINLDANIQTDIDTKIANVLVALLTQLGDMNITLPALPEVPQVPGQSEQKVVAIPKPLEMKLGHNVSADKLQQLVKMLMNKQH